MIDNSKVEVLERLLFRVSRGNCYVHVAPESDWLTDPITNDRVSRIFQLSERLDILHFWGAQMEKRVFMVFYYASVLGLKINKLLVSLGAEIYPFPEDDR